MKRTLQVIIFSLLILVSGAGNSVWATNDEPAAGDNAPAVRTYPNPVLNDLNIDVSLNFVNEFSRVEVKVINLLGQEMTEVVKFDIEKSTQTFVVDMEKIPAGLYMIDINFVGNGTNYKVSKKVRKN